MCVCVCVCARARPRAREQQHLPSATSPDNGDRASLQKVELSLRNFGLVTQEFIIHSPQKLQDL